MSQPASSIAHYMSSVLVVIEPKQPIAEAARLMRLHSIRHLPVVQQQRVVGLISQRDVYLIETLRDVDASEVLVEEAMVEDVYMVEPDTPIHVVATEMADRRIGSAVVARGQRLLGLFTSTDALRALSALVLVSDVADS